METRYRLHAAPVHAPNGVAEELNAARNRSCPRTQVYAVAALAIADSLPEPISCTLRDISDTGARLEMDRVASKAGAPTPQLPENLTLYFCPEKRLAECQLVWQDGRHFGIRFLLATPNDAGAPEDVAGAPQAA
jgi:hypothetical protein